MAAKHHWTGDATIYDMINDNDNDDDDDDDYDDDDDVSFCLKLQIQSIWFPVY